MNIDEWLAKNEIETSELARVIGVTRQVIWKIKKGKTVDTETAQKIRFVTGGSVRPACRSQGRPRLKPRVVNSPTEMRFPISVI